MFFIILLNKIFKPTQISSTSQIVRFDTPLINTSANIAPRLPGQTSIFGAVLGSNWELRVKGNFQKFPILTRKSRSHVRMILIYRTWPIRISESSQKCYYSVKKHHQTYKLYFQGCFTNLHALQEYAPAIRHNQQQLRCVTSHPRGHLKPWMRWKHQTCTRV